MRHIYLPIFLITLGCANSNFAQNTDTPLRKPSASLSGSALPFAAKLSSSMYQGPFEINLEGSTRVPAKSYLPLQYTATKAWPLVIMLHGFSGTADTEDSYLSLSARTSIRGFILLEPEGTVMPAGTLGADGRDLGGNQFWNATDTCCDFAKTGVDDVTYILGLIEKMKGKYNIDSSRVYLIGHSNGGFMVNRLACEAGKSFTAIASLAGGIYKDLKSCHNPVAVSYLQIHAENDKTILYQNAPDYAGGKETVDQWLTKDGCAGPPIQGPRKDFVFLIPGLDTSEQSWKKCASGKDVAFWTIRAYEAKGHSPHVPFFNLNFMDAVLDFLFQHQG